MQDQPAAARLPVRARGVLAQAGDVPPRLAVVIASEQPGRLDAGVQAGRGGRQAPHRLDRVFPGLVSETRAGVVQVTPRSRIQTAGPNQASRRRRRWCP